VFAYGTFFASLVVIPQWLQGAMGYTATWAGYATAFNGVAAVLMAPFVAKRMEKDDPRRLVFVGVLWLGMTSLLRVFWWDSGSDFWTLALPQLIQGAGMPFFFIPLTTIALGAVDEEETASAAGVMNFLRTMAGAIAVAISTTLWYDGAQEKRAALSGILNGAQSTVDQLVARGFSTEQGAAHHQPDGRQGERRARHRPDLRAGFLHLRRRCLDHLVRPAAQARCRCQRCPLNRFEGGRS